MLEYIGTETKQKLFKYLKPKHEKKNEHLIILYFVNIYEIFFIKSTFNNLRV